MSSDKKKWKKDRKNMEKENNTDEVTSVKMRYQL